MFSVCVDFDVINGKQGKDTNAPNISQLIPVGLQNMLILEQFLVQAGWEGSTIKLIHVLFVLH